MPVIEQERARAAHTGAARSGPRHANGPARIAIVRPATESDWPAIIQLVREAAASRDVFTFDDDLDDVAIEALWSGASRVVVADAPGGAIAGTAKMGRNQAGPGDHVATASILVSPSWRRQGVGRRLIRHALAWAAGAGFRAMQFNAVVSASVAAVELWRSEGFRTIGVVPGGFRHPELGFVELLVMYRAIARKGPLPVSSP